MLNRPTEPAPFENIFVKLVVWTIGLAMLVFILTSCGSPTGDAEYAAQTEAANRIRDLPTQTPYVVVVTATHEPVEPTVEPTQEDALVCAPRYLADLTVGYIPGQDIGDKKSSIAVSMGCVTLNIGWDGASLTGIVAEDGLSLESCTLFVTGRAYPCQLMIRNLAEMNVWLTYENKAGKSFPVCVAVDNKNYNVACE